MKKDNGFTYGQLEQLKELTQHQNVNSENQHEEKNPVSSSDGLGRKAPFCRCLHEIENGLERTKFCFKPCAEQMEILREREKDDR